MTDDMRRRGEFPSEFKYEASEGLFTRTSTEIRRVTGQFSKGATRSGQKERFRAIEEIAIDLAMLYMEACPEGSELQIALEKIQGSVLYACSSIMMNETWQV